MTLVLTRGLGCLLFTLLSSLVLSSALFPAELNSAPGCHYQAGDRHHKQERQYIGEGKEKDGATKGPSSHSSTRCPMALSVTIFSECQSQNVSVGKNLKGLAPFADSGGEEVL